MPLEFKFVATNILDFIIMRHTSPPWLWRVLYTNLDASASRSEHKKPVTFF